MKRKIIRIDETLCNGCGNCVTGCSEGALQIIDGKARLVKEDFCDGMGNCIGTCPTGALTIEERDATPFNEEAVNQYLSHQKQEDKTYSTTHYHGGQACPGSIIKDFRKEKGGKASPSKQAKGQSLGISAIPSELQQWPVQLHLVSPMAPYFNNSELAVLSTCSPVASADIHWRFIRDRSVIIACPKLDDTENYVEKLALILKNNNIPKVLSVIMEVPCCKGLTLFITEAVKLSGKKDIVIEECIVGLDGALKEVRNVS